MDTSNIIKGVVNSGRYTVTAPIVKEDYGLYLQIEGVELPQTYEVDFSNSEHNGTSVTMIGNSDGVLIPHQFIDTGKDIFAFLYHVGENFGRTVYKFRIPNKCRPDRTDEEPTPEEQSTIDQAISALNEAVAQTAQDVIDADASAQSAQGYAEQAETAKSDAQTYANNAQASATSASQSATASANSATASAQSASQSAQIETDIEGMVDDAQGYAQASAQSASASANSATSAQGYAQSASASAQSASGYASDAQTSAQTASSKASEASQSASQASGYAQTAETAKTAAQTAKTQAETARDNAVTAKTAAETAQGKAEDAQAAAEAVAESIPSDYSQLSEDVSDLKEDLNSEKVNRINFLALEQGTFIINSGIPNATNIYVRTVSKIEHSAHIETGNADILVAGVFAYNTADDTFVSYTAITNSSSVDVSPVSGTYVRLTFKRRDNTALAPYDIQPDLTITNLVLKSYDTESNAKALMYTRDATDEYVSGYINNSVSVGAAVNPTVLVNAAMKCVDISCRYGDKFVITGSGGQTGRLFAFTDENYKQLKVATPSETESNLELIAPANGHFISNIWTSQPYSLEVTQRASIGAMFPDIQDATAYVEQATKDYTRITDATLLAWKFGVFTSNGIEQSYASGMLPNDRMYTIVKLKKGSTVKRKTFPKSIQVTFGYKLTESDSTLTDYASSASLPITIEQDCIAYIGVRYIPVELILNNEILSGLEFDLLVKDYRSMYDRGNGVKDRYYGWVSPDFYCEGQHVDTTGWTNSFSDVQAIHDAFDALATESNGYLTRIRDYGVVYTGNAGNTLYPSDSEWHIYEYETKQIRPSSAPKLPRIAITCCMHANEKMSAYAMHYLMYDLIHNATKNPVLSYLRNNCIINFIPICNPFGFMSVIPQRLNENGVNLNRNFPTHNWDEWEDTRTDGNGSEYGGQNYKGQSAGSEPETKAMMSFYRNNYDAIFQIDLHTNGADTTQRDQISFTMLTEIDGDNYSIMHSYFNPAMDQCYRLKPWINEEYNGNITNSLFWGGVETMDRYPSAPWWISESNGVIGMCYEVMAGSSNNLLGNKLTSYSADTIKMAAEQLANFIYMMIANCKDAK